MSSTRASPRPFLGLLAMVRNECLSYPEWLAHHRSQGFDAFYLIDNNSTDGCWPYLQLQPDVTVLHWFPRAVDQLKQLNRTESNQARCQPDTGMHLESIVVLPACAQRCSP